MSIITISRGSYSSGKDVAEKVAKKLGYTCVARDDVIEQTASEFNIPEVKLIRAIHDAPSILDRFTYGKERFVAFFWAELLARLQQDNAVYHGLAGHFFLKGISHVLKVRIIADMDYRVKVEMEREGIGRKAALRLLKKDDEERRNWSRHLHGIDTADPSLYDVVIHIKTIGVDDAADIICHTVGLKHFRATAESNRKMADLTLSARVKVALISLIPDIVVSSRNGKISIKANALLSQRDTLYEQIEEITNRVEGVKGVNINIRSEMP